MCCHYKNPSCPRRIQLGKSLTQPIEDKKAEKKAEETPYKSRRKSSCGGLNNNIIIFFPSFL